VGVFGCVLVRVYVYVWVCACAGVCVREPHVYGCVNIMSISMCYCNDVCNAHTYRKESRERGEFSVRVCARLSILPARYVCVLLCCCCVYGVCTFNVKKEERETERERE